MCFKCKWPCLSVLLAFLFTDLVSAQNSPRIWQLTPAQVWSRLEFRIDNVPATPNPFDPDILRVDATFTLPSGRVMTVPGFWYQNYQRSLAAGSEALNSSGSPEWRTRFTPPETGLYSVSVTIQTNTQVSATVTTNFTVAQFNPSKRFGYVRKASSGQYFETGDGQALRLIGENVGWPGSAGTYDYDAWFAAMQTAGENYARMWMCPWWLGLETDRNALTQYRLDRAWQLDYVLQLAEQRGIYLLLCLDFHGMFEVTPDYWGGNNFWPTNPYNVTNGGPCINQNAFFTNTTAKMIYEKRLRYLVARYGYSPSLLGWQFFNEIDNEYAYLNPSDVAAWHRLIGAWLHANDPFAHLVTTSLTGGSDRSEIWTIPQLDFAAYHSYGEASPVSRLATVTQSFRHRYQKPVLIDEFGTDWRGWNRTNDLYLRGFRQGLWAGALGGSVGTAMSWWWESIHSENDYSIYNSLGTILNQTGWGIGAWTNVGFKTSGAPPPLVDQPIAGGQPFDAFLVLGTAWGGTPSGRLAVPNPAASGYSAATLNSFVHGIAHANLKTPFCLNAWLTNSARLVMHLNSVSDGALMIVRADGSELFRTNLPNLDGGYSVNNEYNIDIPVSLPAGKRLIEITNAGIDWFYLDSVRLERVVPANYANNWQPTPEAIGLQGPHESLLYVVAPGVSFPAGATNSTLPIQHAQSVTLTNWPAGIFVASWYDPATAAALGSTQQTAANGSLMLTLPAFTSDLAGVLYSPPILTALDVSTNGILLKLDSETGGRYLLQRSFDLISWEPLFTITNYSASTTAIGPFDGTNGLSFFRAQKVL